MPTFSNQATLSYNATRISSNIVTGEVAQSLYVEKYATPQTYGADGSVTFIVTIRNTGANDNSYTLTDDLGAYEFNDRELVPLTYVEDSLLLFVNGAIQPAPDVTDDSPLTVEGIEIPAGGYALLVYLATPNEFAPRERCSCIVNTVTVNAEGGPCTDSADARICAACEPRLAISKTLTPCSLSDCTEPMTYTFSIRNFGACAANCDDQATVTDTFAPPLNITSVTFNGMNWTRGMHYTYDCETGEFATIPGQITVPAATFEQDRCSGEWVATPGESTLVITGTF